MAGYLVESTTYSPAISKVDAKNDEANLQLANRTRYLNNALNELSNYLSTIKNEQDLQIEDLDKRINQLKGVISDGTSSSSISTSDDVVQSVQQLLSDVSKLERLLQTHTHNYAGSSSPGGPATEVDINDDQINRLFLLGNDTAHFNNIKRNPYIYMEENDLYADTFHGYLDGKANSAETLSHSPNIKLSGVVHGSAIFNGKDNIDISTTLQEQNVSPGEYGELTNYTLPLDGSILIPSITVNSAGIITHIQNRVVQLPSNLGTNNAISATQDARKIFLVGAESQKKYAITYSQAGVYAKDNRLYSNNDQVVTLNERQELFNKIINGYMLNEASEYEVDDTIGGVIDSKKLITSDAVARHTHNFAAAEQPSGDAISVNINDIQENESYEVVTRKDNILYDSGVYVSNNALTSKTLIAAEHMYIPGGKIWLEDVEPGTDSGGNILPGDFLNPDDYVKRVSTERLHYQSISCKQGQLLTYHSGGYMLADNCSRNFAKNLAIALEDSKEDNTVNVMLFGAYNLGEDYFDGADAYVGKAGDIIYGKPMDKDIVIRKIGYVRKNYLIFCPHDDGTAERVDSLERSINKIFYPEIANYAWQLDELLNYIPRDDAEEDTMWDIDEQGDCMPALYCVTNYYWQVDVEDIINIMPVLYIIDEHATTWEEDNDGNLMPLETCTYDSMWEPDLQMDYMPLEEGTTNDIWKNDEDTNIMPMVSEAYTTWEKDNDGNLMPQDVYSYDSMWESDQQMDYMPIEDGITNDIWENDKDTNIMPMVSEAKTTWEEDSNGNLMPHEIYTYDSMWELDKQMDYMSIEVGTTNNVWENDDDTNIMPMISETPITWEEDSNGNLMPQETCTYDFMWEPDKQMDYMPIEEGASNDTWENDDNTNIMPMVSKAYTTWEEDSNGNLMPHEIYTYDSMWESDKQLDYMPLEEGTPNDIWKNDEDTNITLEIKTVWEDDGNGNLMPQEIYTYDSMWELDKQLDYIPLEKGITNYIWENDDANSIIPMISEVKTTWEEDNAKNLMPQETYNDDSMWEPDRQADYMPFEEGLPNDIWENDEDTNIKPVGE